MDASQLHYAAERIADLYFIYGRVVVVHPVRMMSIDRHGHHLRGAREAQQVLAGAPHSPRRNLLGHPQGSLDSAKQARQLLRVLELTRRGREEQRAIAHRAGG